MKIPPERMTALRPNDQFLISYPRSGNTWTRFLVKDVIVLKHPEIEDTVHPNDLIPDVHQTALELDHPAQSRFSMQSRILKSHNIRDLQAYRSVYLFRRAEDALLSYYHFGILRNQPWAIAGETPDAFCRRFLPTWQEHLDAAIAQYSLAAERVLFVSYEQLIENGFLELRRIIDFYGLEAGDEILRHALERNTFQRLRAREEKRVPDAKGYFFRKGCAGSGEEELQSDTLAFLQKETGPHYETASQLSRAVAA